MNDKKTIKISLGTMISIVLIVAIIITLGVTAYFKFMKDSDSDIVEIVKNNGNAMETNNNPNNETQTFSNAEIKNVLQNYLDLREALEGSPEGLLSKLGFTNLNYNNKPDNEGYIKTNIKYADYKNKMLNYVSEEWFENKFTRLIKNVNGDLYYFDGGATGEKCEVEEITLKGDYSYIANVYEVHQDDSKEKRSMEFRISNVNNKCVISYCDF